MKRPRNNPFLPSLGSASIPRLISPWLAAAALAGAPGAGWAGSIAYNFSENPGNQGLNTTTPKGPLATSVWNDNNVRTSGSLAAGNETGLVTDTNTATSAAITWNSAGTWWNGSGTNDEESRIVVGYLDDGGSGVSVTVENIPYAAYNVYGIVGSDQGDTYTTVDFNVNGQWALGGGAPGTGSAYGTWQASSSTWTQIATGVTGNYWKVSGLNGSTLTIQGQPRSGDNRGCLTAIIIEEATFVTPSLLNKPGIVTMPSVNLGNGLTSVFRPGLDSVTVSNANGLSLGSAGNTHTLQIPPRPGITSGTYTLLDYDGTFGGAGFSGLTLLPPANTRYAVSLVNNTSNSSVDLNYTGPEPVLWTGTASEAWTGAANWKLETAGTATTYQDLDIVKFGDLPGGGTKTVDVNATVTPLSVDFTSSTTSYILTGTGGIAGDTAVTKAGSGDLVMGTANTFTGALSILGGTLTASQAGSLGASSGSILLDGATLAASATFNTARSLTVGAAGAEISVPAETTFGFTAGGFNGGNELVKSGAGTLIFDGYNAGGFAGSLDIEEGTVSMEGGAFNGNIGLTQIIVRGGATLLQPAGAYHALGGYYAATPHIFVEEGGTFQIEQENYFDLIDLTGATVAGASELRVDDNFNVSILSSSVATLWSAGINTVVKDAGLFVEDGPLAVDAEISGDIYGDNGIKKDGPGTLLLSGEGTYDGDTTVVDGVLVLGGSGAFDSPLISLGDTATLDLTTLGSWALLETQTLAGSGTVKGDLLVDGTVAPVGLLTFEDGAEFFGGSTLAWDVTSWASGAVAGTDYDTLVLDSLTVSDTSGSPVKITIGVDGLTSLPEFAEVTRTFTIATALSLTATAADFEIDSSAFDAVSNAYGTWAVQVSGGTLQLVYTPGVANAYDTWAAGQGFAPGEQLAGLDPDDDGIPNGIEFVIGGQPTSVDDNAKLPKGVTTPTSLVFTFRQTTASAGMNPVVEYSTTMAPGSWTTAVNGTDGVTIAPGPNDLDGTPTVMVTIPRSTNLKLFARLKIDA